MNDFPSAFRALPEADVPPRLHGAIMRRVLFTQHRPLFFRIGAILALNVVIAVWGVWSRLEADTIDFVRTVVSDIQMSYLSFADGAQMLREVLPMHAVFSILFNLASIGYLMLMFRAEQWRMTKVDRTNG